mmetsp:Transcript_14603/g.35400  ORF Transcript_14603/g.35400 Transcript_14603/m.35400 type:complete len:539 (+) Transcript_14603:71-1687(+)
MMWGMQSSPLSLVDLASCPYGSVRRLSHNAAVQRAASIRHCYIVVQDETDRSRVLLSLVKSNGPCAMFTTAENAASSLVKRFLNAGQPVHSADHEATVLTSPAVASDSTHHPLEVPTGVAVVVNLDVPDVTRYRQRVERMKGMSGGVVATMVDASSVGAWRALQHCLGVTELPQISGDMLAQVLSHSEARSEPVLSASAQAGVIHTLQAEITRLKVQNEDLHQRLNTSEFLRSVAVEEARHQQAECRKARRAAGSATPKPLRTSPPSPVRRRLWSLNERIEELVSEVGKCRAAGECRKGAEAEALSQLRTLARERDQCYKQFALEVERRVSEEAREQRDLASSWQWNAEAPAFVPSVPDPKQLQQSTEEVSDSTEEPEEAEEGASDEDSRCAGGMTASSTELSSARSGHSSDTTETESAEPVAVPEPEAPREEGRREESPKSSPPAPVADAPELVRTDAEADQEQQRTAGNADTYCTNRVAERETTWQINRKSKGSGRGDSSHSLRASNEVGRPPRGRRMGRGRVERSAIWVPKQSSS